MTLGENGRLIATLGLTAVCAESAIMWRVRSSPLSARVRSCLRTTPESYSSSEQHPATQRLHLEDCRDHRLHAQPDLHSNEHLGVLVGMACDERGTREKDLDGASTVGKGHAVHPDGALLPSHRGITGSKRHEGLGRQVMEEDIHLVGGQHL